jgi:hypothetical protein
MLEVVENAILRVCGVCVGYGAWIAIWRAIWASCPRTYIFLLLGLAMCIKQFGLMDILRNGIIKIKIGKDIVQIGMSL